jgi:hypothetical protein
MSGQYAQAFWLCAHCWSVLAAMPEVILAQAVRLFACPLQKSKGLEHCPGHWHALPDV